MIHIVNMNTVEDSKQQDPTTTTKRTWLIFVCVLEQATLQICNLD